MQKVGSHKISAAQFCAEDAEWCTYTFLFTRDFVDHDEYIVEIDFPDPEEYLLADGVSPDHAEPLFDADTLVTSINPDFTRFEIGWKYFWFCQTLLIMFCPCGLGFMSALRRQRKDNGQKRTYHQKWTAQLLWGLLWFDDPFIALTVYTNWAKFFSAVFILSASIFVFLILLFWLCFLSDLRFMQSGDGNGRRGICYWIPKVRMISRNSTNGGWGWVRVLRGSFKPSLCGDNTNHTSCFSLAMFKLAHLCLIAAPPDRHRLKRVCRIMHSTRRVLILGCNGSIDKPPPLC